MAAQQAQSTRHVPTQPEQSVDSAEVEVDSAHLYQAVAPTPQPNDRLTERIVPDEEVFRLESIKTLKELLAKGAISPHSIPQTFLEAEYIVDPGSPQALAFQQSMQELTRRLFPHLDQSKHQITFVLADGGNTNGYIVTTPTQSLICFDLALLKTFENLDQLAWVLAHELTHLEYRGIFEDIPNCPTEEAICDLRPLWAMFDAGFSSAEAETYATKMAEHKQPAWMALADVHGLPPFRVSAIQLGLVTLRDRRGALKETTEQLPNDFQLNGALAGARHTSHLNEILDKQEYSSKDTFGKLQILQGCLSELDPRFPRRTRDLEKHLRDIKVNPRDKNEREILIQMMDALLENPAAFNLLHRVIKGILDNQKQDRIRYYAPRLRALAKAAREFIEAEDNDSRHEKETAAENFISRLESLPAWQSIDWSTVGLPHFELASLRDYKTAIKAFKRGGDDVVLPWHELAEASGSDNRIARALLCLGTLDDRIVRAGRGDLQWMYEHLQSAQSALLSQSGGSQYSSCISLPRDKDGDLWRANLVTDGAGFIKSLDLDVRSSGVSNTQRMEQKIRDTVQVFLIHGELSNETLSNVLQLQSTRGAPQSAESTLTFIGLPYSQFMQDPYGHLRVNQAHLSPPFDLPPDEGPTRHELFAHIAASTAASASELLSYFEGMLAVTNEPERTQYRSFVKNFFLQDSNTGTFTFESLKSGMLYLGPSRISIAPYLRWIIDDKQLFTLTEKGHALGEFTEMPASFYRSIVGVEKPQNVAGLLEIIHLYRQLDPERDYESANTPVRSFGRISDSAISEEVCGYLEGQQDVGPLWQLFSAHGERLEFIRYFAPTDISRILLRYVEQETQWPADPQALSSIYGVIDSWGLFLNEDWRVDFAKRLFASIDSTPDLNKRITALETLLLGKPLKDVDVRSGAIVRWVDSVATIFGADDTTTWESSDCSYLTRIQPVLDRISAKAPSGVREVMLRDLGTRIVAQRQVSHALERAALGNMSHEELLGLGLLYGSVQMMQSLLADRQDYRELTIKFLARPISVEALTRFSRQISKDTRYVYGLLGEDHLSNYEDAHHKRRIRLACKRMHENFWEWSPEARLTVLKDLLLPPEQLLEDHKAGVRTSFERACDFVISELLPLQDNAGQPLKYAAEARRLLTAFLAPGVLDHRQQPVFLAGLMAAAQRSNDETNRLSVGQRLATIFEIMGPAWRKFGQAISSHPSTPPDIALDMEPLKGKSSVSRPQAWALYEQTVPEEIRQRYSRLGPVLESASFFTAVDAGDNVFTFLTPNALARAEDGFSIMESFANEIHKAEDPFSSIAEPVSDMIRSARISAALETNGMVGAAQQNAMRELYQGLVVHIGKRSYRISTAAWRDHGPEFRRMEKMKGPTFNDLPTRTPEQLLHKRNVAKAILYVELRNILSGDAFCVDRHGRNIRVNGNEIGHFDHGAVHAIIRDKRRDQIDPVRADEALRNGGSVEVTRPSDAELLQLSRALFSSFEQLASGDSLAHIVHNEIREARARTGQTPEYLIRVERALLALNDCLKCLDTEGQDIKDILGSLYLNQAIHPIICGELEKMIKERQLSGVKRFVASFVSVSSMVNELLQRHIQDRINTTRDVTLPTPASQWYNNPKNTQDFPSLLKTTDFRRRKKLGGADQSL